MISYKYYLLAFDERLEFHQSFLGGYSLPLRGMVPSFRILERAAPVGDNSFNL